MADSLNSSVQLAVRSLAPWLPPWVQSALTVLDRSLDVRPAAIFEARLFECLESWRAELKRPLEGAYRPQELDAQSFVQLVLLTIDAAVKERLGDKRRMYGRILAHADTPEWRDKVGRVEEVLAALIQVSEADLRVLKVIIAHVSGVPAQGISEEKYLEAAQIRLIILRAAVPDLSVRGARTHLTRLERLGLVLQRQTMGVGDDWTHLVYEPTHLLQELMLLIATTPNAEQ
jgi:hypothetical protein